MSSGSQASGHRQLRPERPAWILWLGMLVVTGLVCVGIAEVTLRLLLPSTTIAMMRGGHYVWYAGYNTYVPQTYWGGGTKPGSSLRYLLTRWACVILCKA